MTLTLTPCPQIKQTSFVPHGRIYRYFLNLVYSGIVSSSQKPQFFLKEGQSAFLTSVKDPNVWRYYKKGIIAVSYD